MNSRVNRNVLFQTFFLLALVLGACAKKEEGGSPAGKDKGPKSDKAFTLPDCEKGAARKIASLNVGVCLTFDTEDLSVAKRAGVVYPATFRFWKLLDDSTADFSAGLVRVPFMEKDSKFVRINMPEHHHPDVAVKVVHVIDSVNLSKGLYRAPNMEFDMPGKVEIIVGKGAISDPAVITLEVN